MNIVKSTWKHSKAWIFTTCITLVLLLVVNLVLTQNLFLKETFNMVFGGESAVLKKGDADAYQYFEGKYETKKDALAAANALNEDIVEEGIVLLKNENNALPLASGAKVSVFGKNSVDMVYSGSGSSGTGGSSGATTLYQSLKSAGFDYNPTLKSFYEDNSASGDGRGENPGMNDGSPSGHPTGETPQSSYTNSVKNSYKNYNDAAIVVFSRIGGEGFDLPRTMKTKSGGKISGAASEDDHYLQLDANETALIKALDASEDFDKIIVIINCSATLELGFLDDPTHYAYSEKIEGALWVGSPGKSGATAIGKVLKGEVNPSGKTVDIYARNFKNDPTWQNFGNNFTADGNSYYVNGKKQKPRFVEYEEGIYYGYRYYETRGATETDPTWYSQNVVFPFGYGLSYTDFTWEITPATTAEGTTLAKDGTITISVEVTNTGDVAGKDVVEVYYSAPYVAGGIEKSHVVLAGFAKTDMIEPGESDTVEIYFNVSSMASYDYNDANANDFSGYEVEEGEYQIYVAKNSNDSTTAMTYNVPLGGFQYDTIGGEEEGITVQNHFDYVSNHFDGTISTLLSRNDWEGTWPSKPTKDGSQTVEKAVIDSIMMDAKRGYTDAKGADKWYVATTPKYAKKEVKNASVKLYQLIDKNEDGSYSVDYNNPLWDELLNQITLEQMSVLIGAGAFNTKNIDGIDKPKTTDADGPAGFTIFMGDPSVYDTCLYAGEVVLASTWNTELAYAMGEMVGEEGILGNLAGDGRSYSGWYAPAVNIHRSQFGGRNWEYYSEDGLLSGQMAASVISGAESKGVYTFLKHFALNEQETDRNNSGLVTWATEQAIREIYLKPFEIAVKEGQTTAMMSSFTRIGNVWAGGSYELLTNVLREEWGFKGMVITDFNASTPYMDIDQMIRAGGDLNLGQDMQPSNDYTSTQVASMRKATKNILYTVASSNAMNGHGAGNVWGYSLPRWVNFMIIIDVVFVLGFAVWGFFAIRKAIKKDKSSDEKPATEVTTNEA